MSHLPNTPQPFSEILGLSIRYHFGVFKPLFLPILLLVIVKDAYVYVGHWLDVPYALFSLFLVMGVLITYLISVMLFLCYAALRHEAAHWRMAFRQVWPCFGKVLLILIIFIALPYVLFTLGDWLTKWLVADPKAHLERIGLILTFCVGVPCLLFYLRFFYAIPLVIMENVSFREAFQQAGALCTKKENWIRVFGLYACGVAVWILVSPDTLHGHLIKMYKLSAPFDWVVFCVTLPILMNLVVLLRNDLGLRKALRDAAG